MDNIMRISIADIFIRVNSGRDGIIRHNCTAHASRTIQFERTFSKDAHMHIKVVSGINRIFAVSIMRIPSAFTGAAARPVFRHRVDRTGAPAIFGAFGGLDAVTVSTRHILRHFHMCTESISCPHPARIGTEVNLGRQRRSNTHCTVFLGNDCGMFFYNLRTEGRSQSKSLRPFGSRNDFTRLAAGRIPGAMTRVRGSRHRNTKRRTLREALNVIIPAGKRLNTGNVGYQYRSDAIP